MFYENITISKSLSSQTMLIFSEIKPVEKGIEAVPEKQIQNELKFTLTKDTLNMHRPTTMETAVVGIQKLL